jgi:hypothetical protein
MILNLAEIPGAFHLPRPDWDVIRGWVESHVPQPERSEAWTNVATQWLEVLNTALGNRYQIGQRANLLLLAPHEFEDFETLLGFAESGLTKIVNALGSLAGEGWLGPLVILLFADPDTYYAYASQFYPEGEFGASGGMCFGKDYVHIGLHPARLGTLQRSLLHELTHACLSHLKLPRWLAEGLTQTAEETAAPSWAQFTLDEADAVETKRYWREHGLGNFWWGKGFVTVHRRQNWRS